jgi:hypothetical protein
MVNQRPQSSHAKKKGKTFHAKESAMHKHLPALLSLPVGNPGFLLLDMQAHFINCCLDFILSSLI